MFIVSLPCLVRHNRGYEPQPLPQPPPLYKEDIQKHGRYDELSFLLHNRNHFESFSPSSNVASASPSPPSKFFGCCLLVHAAETLILFPPLSFPRCFLHLPTLPLSLSPLGGRYDTEGEGKVDGYVSGREGVISPIRIRAVARDGEGRDRFGARYRGHDCFRREEY